MPFITNSQNRKLEDRLKDIIPKTQEIKILVGFFYFSAAPFFYEILKKMYEQGTLKKGHVKILVGLEVDHHVNGLYEYASEQDPDEYLSDKDIQNNFLKSLQNAFRSNQTDKSEFYAQADFFIKILQEGQLIIKKTRKPNHSKLYLFKLEDTITPSLIITGSSNLTYAGLSHQDEFNVEIKDYGFEQAEAYFDELWNQAAELESSKVIERLNDQTFFKQVTPFEAYVHVLKTYIETYTDLSEKSQQSVEFILQEAHYRPFTYQVEAINQAVKIIQTHNGVILADVVGLGKSVIATAIAKKLGLKGVVVAPPHLMGDDLAEYGWKKYLADFQLYEWKVFSVGELERARDYVHKHDEIKVVIVDEAHRFRNENTKNYFLLQQICRGKHVILLTATPFNNRPADIYAMLKLFTIPKKSTIVFDEDLKSKFEDLEKLFNKLHFIKINPNTKKAKKYYDEIFESEKIDLKRVNAKFKQLATEIKGLIEPVVIRRNRLDLQDYPEKIELSQVKDPKESFFELTKEQSEFYDEVIQAFSDILQGGQFTGALYVPQNYKLEHLKKDEGSFQFQKNLYSLMRRLLVKRLESSFAAFYDSIQRFLEIHENALEFITKYKKYVMDRDLIEEILESPDDQEIQQKLKNFNESLKYENGKSKYEFYEIKDLKPDFLNDIKKDIELFRNIKTKFEQLDFMNKDPKAQKLVEEIKHYLADRKVVIFTEYVDTADHLKGILEKHFPGQVLAAYGRLSQNSLNAIDKNFGPEADSQAPYTILLATDKLSEGFNLNKAGVIINYDIPWNPVRVIQRVGRINRIGKKVYDELFIVNFFPTEKGADIVRSRQIAQNKMFMIHKVLGEDAKILSPDEEPEPAKLYQKINTFTEAEQESFITKVRKEFYQIKHQYPHVMEKIKNLAPRIKVAKKHPQNNLVVIIKKSQDLFIALKEPEKHLKLVSFQEAYEHIRSTPADKPLQLSQNFWPNYQEILKYKPIKKINVNAKDREGQAISTLNSIKNKIPKELKDYIDELIDEIRNLGTLSEYALAEIIRWATLSEEDLISKIYEFKKGFKSLNLTALANFNVNPDYILAIENQEV